MTPPTQRFTQHDRSIHLPLFGAHMSIAGGYHKALLAAQDHQCQTVQLFTKNNNQWAAKDLTKDEVKLFRKTLRQSKLKYPTAHDCYLINLASPDKALYRKSIEAFAVEMERAERLGLTYLVTHPGAHKDSGEKRGLRRVIRALDEIHKRCPNYRVQILLETTAGQGSSLGYRFEHLADIINAIQHPERVGVCLDTCHVFAAGYPLSPRREYSATISDFHKTIGLSKLKCFHVNDSKKGQGSRVDRHEHIGKGKLGLEPFQLLTNDYRFRGKPMILETPKEQGDNDDMDRVNLDVLNGLVAKKKLK